MSLPAGDSRSEICTISIPTAGHLVALGIEPKSITFRMDGVPVVHFEASALDAMTRFFTAKRRVDAMVETARSQQYGGAR